METPRECGLCPLPRESPGSSDCGLFAPTKNLTLPRVPSNQESCPPATLPREPLRPSLALPIQPTPGSPEPCRKCPGKQAGPPYLISVWPPALRAICTSSFPYRSSAWALQRQPPGTGLVHGCWPKLTLRRAQTRGRVCPCRLWPCRCLLETVKPPALLNKRWLNSSTSDGTLDIFAHLGEGPGWEKQGNRTPDFLE